MENKHFRVRGSERFPGVIGKLHHTPDNDVSYFKHPSVVLVNRPDINLDGWYDHLFEAYPEHQGNIEKHMLDAQVYGGHDSDLVRAAGQGCYASFLSTFTSAKEVDRYVDNLMSSGHFSVFEHLSYTFYAAGVSRSLTHEWVRHRHESPSQLSQRYVDGKALRFVMRPEYDDMPDEQELFMRRIERAAQEYEDLAARLLTRMDLTGYEPRDRRKRVNQVARETLPNCTETNLFMSGNIRAWVHFLVLRGSVHAETEIQRLAWWVLWILKQVNPECFHAFDFEDADPVNGWKKGLRIPYSG